MANKIKIKDKYDFRNVAVKSRDHEAIGELAFRNKMPRYKVVHMLLEEWREANIELQRKFQLTPKEFEVLRDELKEKYRAIKAEAMAAAPKQYRLRDRSP